jgi:hypothetical protein
MAEGLTVDVERMKTNLEASGGLVFSEAVSYALAEKLGRAEAHDVVAEIAREAEKQKRPFKELLAEHDKVKLQISLTELERLFRPNHYQGSAQNFIDRLVASSQGRSVRRSVSHMLEPKLPAPNAEQLSAVAAATSALIATAAAATSAPKPTAEAANPSEPPATRAAKAPSLETKPTDEKSAEAPPQPDMAPQPAKGEEAQSLPRIEEAAPLPKSEDAPPLPSIDSAQTLPKTGGMPSLPKIGDTFAPRPALKREIEPEPASESRPEPALPPAPVAAPSETPTAEFTAPKIPSAAPPAAEPVVEPPASDEPDTAAATESAPEPLAASEPPASEVAEHKAASEAVEAATSGPTARIDTDGKTGDTPDDKPGALLDMFARIEAETDGGSADSDPPAERKRA